MAMSIAPTYYSQTNLHTKDPKPGAHLAPIPVPSFPNLSTYFAFMLLAQQPEARTHFAPSSIAPPTAPQIS